MGWKPGKFPEFCPPQSLLLASCWFLAWLLLQLGRWKRNILTKCRLNFMSLYPWSYKCS
jgi:hypothetical protein